MGFFDFFRSSSDPYEKYEKTLTNMYVQPNEREFIISQLRDEASPKACRVMLMRFSKNAPNTTVDLKEKEMVYRSLVMLGKETDLDVAELVKDHLRTAEDHVNWPLRILSDLMNYDEFTAFIAELLSELDTMYQRDPEKKHELLIRAKDHASPDLAQQVIKFFEDDNDTIRFAAIRASFSQTDAKDDVIEGLVKAWQSEESVRNTKEIASGFATSGWEVPAQEVELLSAVVPTGFSLSADGKVKAN